MSVPNLAIYNHEQLLALKDAVIAERLRRVSGGTVMSGSKNGKSFSVQTASEQELNNLEDALAKRLGKSAPQVRRIDLSRP